MDPYYFISENLEAIGTIEGEDANTLIHEYCDFSPDGDWVIEMPEGVVLKYINHQCTKIDYNNEAKIFSLTQENGEFTRFKITIEPV